MKPKFLRDYEAVYKEIYKKDLYNVHKKSIFEINGRNNIKDKLFELRFDITSPKSRSSLNNVDIDVDRTQNKLKSFYDKRKRSD